MHTSYLGDADLAAAHLEQTADIAATVAEALAAAGPGARACVLPEGPQTIPYLARPDQPLVTRRRRCGPDRRSPARRG
jgi:hypothetical protein